MEVILMSVAVLGLAAAVIFAMINAQHKKALSELTAKLAVSEQRLRESRIQFEAKSKETEELRSRLDRTRDETKKAKKRAFERERQDKEKAIVPPVVTLQDEDVLLEARAQARQAMAAAARATEEKTYALEQQEKLKGELATAKQALKARHEDALKAERGESERIKKLELELTGLQEKLEIARRKSRTDAQVYRITKSKLDLALEKITGLERTLGGASSHSLSDEPADATLSAPPPVHDETESLSSQETENTPE